MFRNPSKSIKTFGEVVCLLGWLFSLIIGIVLLTAAAFRDHPIYENTFWQYIPIPLLVSAGCAVIIFGLINFFLMGVFVYGFGEIVEKVNIMSSTMEHGKVDISDETETDNNLVIHSLGNSTVDGYPQK